MRSSYKSAVILLSLICSSFAFAQTASVTMDQTFSNLTTNKPLEIGVNNALASHLTIAAKASQFQIQSLEIATDNGEVTYLTDLLTDPVNQKSFGKGFIDKTGVANIPSKIVLSLGGTLRVTGIRLALARQKTGIVGEVQVSLSNLIVSSTVVNPIIINTPGSSNGGIRPAQPIGGGSNNFPPPPLPPGNGNSPNIPPPPLPPVKPNIPPPPLPPIPQQPVAMCNGPELLSLVSNTRAQVESCAMDVGQKRQTLSQAVGIQQTLIGQKSRSNKLMSEYNSCLAQVSNSNQQLASVNSAIESERSRIGTIDMNISNISSLVSNIQNYSGVWSCWIQDRNGNRYQSTERGAPGTIMAKIAKNFCKDSCGKRSKDKFRIDKAKGFSWSCDPAQPSQINPIALPQPAPTPAEPTWVTPEPQVQPTQPTWVTPEPAQPTPAPRPTPQPVVVPPQSNDGFDGLCYLTNYKDIRDNWGARPIEHWISNGRAEGRNPGCDFVVDPATAPDPNVFHEQCYLERYPDIRAGWKGPAIQHYIKAGQREGRIPGCSKR
ncbi:MAG: hypothetical protein V4736_06575 [Bdellovibrionota bacterium]